MGCKITDETSELSLNDLSVTDNLIATQARLFLFLELALCWTFGFPGSLKGFTKLRRRCSLGLVFRPLATSLNYLALIYIR